MTRLATNLLLFVAISFATFSALSALECGYESCNKVKPDALNIHIIPHSHDDVGWLKTVQQYYDGSNKKSQYANVSQIISSVVEALKDHPERRFIQVESFFFHKWWHDQSDDVKELVHRLVANGQFEFTGGAWSMNDEAAADFHSIIEQFTFGLKFLNDTFGSCGLPKIGWQIDPFGHSNEMASQFAQMGYDGVILTRIDYRDKRQRLSNQNMEMIWQGSHNLGNESNIFTSIMFNHYNAPEGFCFDATCSDESIVDDPENSHYNLERKLRVYTGILTDAAKHFKTNNLLVPMGGDFNYMEAHNYYKNLDALMGGFTKFPQEFEGKPINIFYSTPACYVKAVNDVINAKKIELPLETNDFFPYGTDAQTYWTGYFSSRPASKRSARKSLNLLQVHKQLAAFTAANNEKELFEMQNAVGIMQHHDAITGTEQQHVANDYARIMHNAFLDSGDKINKHISKLLTQDPTKPIQLNLKQCFLKNITICDETLTQHFTIVLYNPSSSAMKYPVRVPVNILDYELTDLEGNKIAYQSVPTISTNEHAQKYEMTFIANLPPMGIKVYKVQRARVVTFLLEEDTTDGKYKLGDEQTSITLDPSSGVLSSVTINSVEIKVRQELLYYNSKQNSGRNSGAYVFRNKGDAIAFSKDGPVKITTYKGKLFDEVHQEYSSWAKQVIRVYKDQDLADNIEFDWLVGPIPVKDRQGKEVISRFTSELESGDEFYTDANGRELLHRVRDKRPSYDFKQTEAASGNYYPITSEIAITDGKLRLAVLNDRPQGGSSLKSGEVELMVHRATLYDDYWGVGEPLNENENGVGLIARGRHYLTVSKVGHHGVERSLADKLAFAPWLFIDNTTSKETLTSIQHEFSGLKKDAKLPEHVRILTLEPVVGHEDTLLLRLENFFEDDISKVQTVSLKGLFENFEVVSIEETNLVANQRKKDAKRLNWYK